jgi:hypothetical protein
MKIKFKIKSNQFSMLRQAISRIPVKSKKAESEIVNELAILFRNQYLEKLGNQGRPGGAPPSLSAATRYLYQQIGWPDGSGVRNHIQIEQGRTRSGAIAKVGIPKGKPTMIAKVQDRGAIIQVTPKMRGWLAAHGIFLRAETSHIIIPARYAWRDSVDWIRTQARITLNQKMRKIIQDAAHP